MAAPYAPQPFEDVSKQSPKSNPVLMTVLIVAGVLFLLALCVIGVLAALLYPAVGQARMAAQRVMAKNSAKEISLALHHYHDDHRQFPAARTTDGTVPLMSWRVELLPYLEESARFNQIKIDKPWNDGTNLYYTSEPVEWFSSPRCPDSQGTNRTAFVAVVGPDTVLRADVKNSFAAIADGSSNTGVFLEIHQSDIAWAEPRDVTVDEAVRMIQSFADPAGPVVALADGFIITVPQSTPAEEIIKLFNCSDGVPRIEGL